MGGVHPVHDAPVLERTDAEIVAAVLAGDRERFGVLVDRHGRALLGFLRRRTGGEEARELFQATWVEAFEGLAGLRDPARLRSWLVSIAHNLVRRRARGPSPTSLDEVEGRPASGEPVGAGLERRELAARIRAAVARLPGRQREVFELRAVAELPYAEIAAALDIREDNARAHFHQAARKLRALLDEDDDR